MNRQPQHRAPGKSSFRATPEERQAVHRAIDDSLYSVRFNAQDTRAVMHAIQTGKKKAAKKRKRRLFKPDLLFAASLVLVVALPLSLHAMRSRERIITIASAPGQPAALSNGITAQNDLISEPETAVPTAAPKEQSAVLCESDAIRIAQDCFNAHCDTSIFTFEEYTVSAALNADAQQYTVALESIYKNGCYFTVVLSAESGDVVQFSAPELATTPAYLNAESDEVRAWYDKYGEFPVAWAQDVQAEFSRRYQGGTLRAAREGELTRDQAIAAARDSLTDKQRQAYSAFYPVLYSERAAADGHAYYLVYCYAQPIEDGAAQGEPLLVSLDAVTGEVIDAR